MGLNIVPISEAQVISPVRHLRTDWGGGEATLFGEEEGEIGDI